MSSLEKERDWRMTYHLRALKYGLQKIPFSILPEVVDRICKVVCRDRRLDNPQLKRDLIMTNLKRKYPISAR